jgi:hypothetical protein
MSGRDRPLAVWGWIEIAPPDLGYLTEQSRS